MPRNFSKKNVLLLLQSLLAILALIIVGLVIMIVMKNKLQWGNKDAMEQHNILKKKYGNPNSIGLSRGGIAVWEKNKLQNTCFERIELYDESVAHCVPKPHRDFLYTFVKYEVPNDKVLDVISLSGSVAYDPLKKLLRARCASEEANIATLYLATGIGNSNVTIKDIQEKKMYAETITSTISSQNVQIYYTKLCEALENQPGNPEWTGFFPLAFPEGCCEGYDSVLNTCGETRPDNVESDKSENSHEHTGDKSENFYGDKSDKSENFCGGDKSEQSQSSKNIPPVLF
jgi:hypothetical protein